MEDLGFALDADYIENQKYFMDSNEIPEVVVWLESHDDCRLWLPLFEGFDKFKFVFKPASIFPAPDGKSSNGCSRLLALLDRGQINLGKYQIFCLDSDFRFTSKIADDFAGSVNADGNIYWTLVHSKESIYFNPVLVDKVISHQTGVSSKHLKQTSEEIFQNISEQVYEPFSKILYLEALLWGKTSSELSYFKSNFKAAMDILKSKPVSEAIEFSGCTHWNDFIEALAVLDVELNSYLAAQSLLDRFKSYQKSLSVSGVVPSNVYFFVRGHDWSEVVKELSCKRLEFHKKRRIGEIVSAASTNAPEKIREYVGSFGSFTEILSSRTPIYDGVPFFDSTLNQIKAQYA
ncbi:DUF4435 domain-containing protein [Pseudomonas sp. MYb118]|uniref:DUF4435 domain-containing protein n=1 Tax=Pseudomonas sp. MYb118 TaxID=1848720 RepID=UPI0034CEF58A